MYGSFSHHIEIRVGTSTGGGGIGSTWSNRSRPLRRTWLLCSPSFALDRTLWPLKDLHSSPLSFQLYFDNFVFDQENMITLKPRPQVSILWANSGWFGIGPLVLPLRICGKKMLLISYAFCAIKIGWLPSHSGHPIEQPLENQKQAWPKCEKEVHFSPSIEALLWWLLHSYLKFGRDKTCPLVPVKLVPLETGHLQRIHPQPRKS